jgi:DNA-binding protein H-NS
MASNSYRDIKARIAALEQKAATARAMEVEAVLADVRQKVTAFGLTERDVFGRQRSTRKTTGAAKVSGVMKYRDPKTGAEWSGRGRAPKWIATAKNRDRFLISR